MSQETPLSRVAPMLLTFLAGAAAGAVLVALTTPKTGAEVRGDLVDLARRAKRKAGLLAEEAEETFEDVKQSAVQTAGQVKKDLAAATKVQ